MSFPVVFPTLMSPRQRAIPSNVQDLGDHNKNPRDLRFEDTPSFPQAPGLSKAFYTALAGSPFSLTSSVCFFLLWGQLLQTAAHPGCRLCGCSGPLGATPGFGELPLKAGRMGQHPPCGRCGSFSSYRIPTTLAVPAAVATM